MSLPELEFEDVPDWLTVTAQELVFPEIVLTASANTSEQPRSAVIKVVEFHDENTKGVTEVTVNQQGVTSEGFGSTYESFIGKYTVTGEELDGSTYTATVDLAQAAASSFNLSGFYPYNDQWVTNYTQTYSLSYSNDNIQFPQWTLFNPSGNVGGQNYRKFGWVVFDEAGADYYYLGNQVHSEMTVNTDDKYFIYDEVFESSEPSLMKFNGQPVRLAYVWNRNGEDEQEPYMNLANLKFQWIGPLD